VLNTSTGMMEESVVEEEVEAEDDEEAKADREAAGGEIVFV
jgi:hypothetical protein